MMKHVLRWLIVSIPCSLFAVDAQKASEILVRNSIKPKMLEYMFFKTGYSPDSFKLSVNGKEIKPGSSIAVAADQKNLTVRYDYSFAKGWRTGAKEIIFELDANNKEYNLEFSWNNEWRVIAAGATPKKVKRVKYQA